MTARICFKMLMKSLVFPFNLVKVSFQLEIDKHWKWFLFYNNTYISTLQRRLNHFFKIIIINTMQSDRTRTSRDPYWQCSSSGKGLNWGSGPRYQILSHFFARCASQKTHGHARIACVSHAILACLCVFACNSRMSDSRNVQKSVTQIIYLRPLPINNKLCLCKITTGEIQEQDK